MIEIVKVIELSRVVQFRKFTWELWYLLTQHLHHSHRACSACGLKNVKQAITNFKLYEVLHKQHCRLINCEMCTIMR